MRFGQLEHFLAFGKAHASARWVLKIGDDVGKFWFVGFYGGLERLEVDAIWLEPHVHHVQAVPLQQQDRAVIRGRFDQHGRARLEDHAEQIHKRQRPITNQDLIGAHAILCAQQFAQRAETVTRAVAHRLECQLRVLHDRLGAFGDLVDWIGFVGGHASGQGNLVHTRSFKRSRRASSLRLTSGHSSSSTL